MGGIDRKRCFVGVIRMRVVFQLIEPLLKRRIEIVHGLESANEDRGWKVLFNALFAYLNHGVASPLSAESLKR